MSILAHTTGRYRQVFWFLPFAIIASSLFSCMETTAPDDNQLRRLRVSTLRRSADSLIKTPIVGARVEVARQPGGNSQAMESLTDERGQALFSLDLPLTGALHRISARAGQQVQSRNALLLCVDTNLTFVFDTNAAPLLLCGRDQDEFLTIVDNLGSPTLVQGLPAGVSAYESCISVVNTGNVSLRVTVPEYRHPTFSLTTVLVDGRAQTSATFDVRPNSILTFCFSASTLQAGSFRDILPVRVECQGQNSTLRVNVRADVVNRTCTCESLQRVTQFTIPNRVQVDSAVVQRIRVFTNSLSCDLTVSDIRIVDPTNNGEWTLVSPPTSEFVPQGQSFSVDVRFRPRSIPPSTGELRYRVVTSTGLVCDLTMSIDGEACAPACPQILVSGTYRSFGTVARLVDTVSNRNDNRVFVTLPTLFPPLISTATARYRIRLSDSACAGTNITMLGSGQDAVSGLYFTVSPSLVFLSPGQETDVEVTFRAPSLPEFDQILSDRRQPPGRAGVLADSAFVFNLVIQSPECRQDIQVNAVVTKFPEVSPIINLRAYNQETTQKPTQENEVYVLGENSRRIMRQANGANGAFPPVAGDLYVTVPNPQSGVPPQQPSLVLRNDRFTGMKIWQNGYPERDFDNVALTFTRFEQSPFRTGYTTGPLTGLQPGDVVALQYSPTLYGLIFIRRVDTGVELTSSRQSAIEFRSLFPISIP